MAAKWRARRVRHEWHIRRQGDADQTGGKTGEDFLIVDNGASAGGIQALKEFFQNVSADSRMAYVVVLHLSPNHDSQLAEILQIVMPIPISQVRDESVRVEPNHVYVIPPNKSLAMNEGHLASRRFRAARSDARRWIFSFAPSRSGTTRAPFP